MFAHRNENNPVQGVDKPQKPNSLATKFLIFNFFEPFDGIPADLLIFADKASDEIETKFLKFYIFIKQNVESA